MKYILKLESLGLFVLFTGLYRHLFEKSWGEFGALFFVPDLAFLAFFMSKKAGAIAYNLSHHQGVWIAFFVMGYFFAYHEMTQVSLVFLAHSAFDRVAGYGLKYFDSFDHTHLGWIGKSKHLNKDE